MIYQSLSRKESSSYTTVSFWGDSTGHQSIVLLRPTQLAPGILSGGPLPRPWFRHWCNGARDLSWFYSDRFDQKNIVGCTWTWFLGTWAKVKLLSLGTSRDDNWPDYLFGCLLPASSRVYVPTRISLSINATPVIAILFSCSCPFLTLTL